MSDLLNAALSYQQAGPSVIPIQPSKKRPLIAWEQYQDRIATMDPGHHATPARDRCSPFSGFGGTAITAITGGVAL